MKAIYNYTKDHLLEWFPKLPSYQAFSRRINDLCPVFQALAEIWMDQVSGCVSDERVRLVDSCPIILAKGSRSGHARVASDICAKSYSSSRQQWYYGVKLHAFVSRHEGSLPTPAAMFVSSAAEHDLTAAKQIILNQGLFQDITLYADKAYADTPWREDLEKERHVRLLTPRKKKKDDVLVSGDAFSTFVASTRQAIEGFFNWLNEHTGIQSASKVRSQKGLLTHIFGRLAAALTKLHEKFRIH